MWEYCSQTDGIHLKEKIIEQQGVSKIIRMGGKMGVWLLGDKVDSSVRGKGTKQTAVLGDKLQSRLECWLQGKRQIGMLGDKVDWNVSE